MKLCRRSVSRPTECGLKTPMATKTNRKTRNAMQVVRVPRFAVLRILCVTYRRGFRSFESTFGRGGGAEVI